MKKLLYFFIFVTIVALASCAKDDVVMPDIEGDTMVSFEVNAIGDETSPQAMRAYNAASYVSDLEYAIYKKESDGTYKFIKNVSIDNFFAEGKQSGTFKEQLGYGKTYVIMLWADCTDDNYTVTWENDITACKVAIADPDALVSQDDSADAFFAKVEVLVSDAAPAPIDMARPFAQINVCTNDYDAAVTRGFTATQTSMKVDAYTSLNLFSGEVGDKDEITFALAALPTGDDATLDGFKRIAMNYVFAPEVSENTDITFYDNSELNALNWSDIGITRNQRTNICGSLLSNNDWDVYYRIIDINVMQFNVMNTTTAWQQIAQLAKDNNIDILCCQELQAGRIGFNNIRNNLNDVPQGVEKPFGADVIYDRSSDGEGTCIFYRNSKFELVSQRRYWLLTGDDNVNQPGITSDGGYTAKYERFAVWAIFREKSTGIEFFVTTAHLDNQAKTPNHAFSDYYIQWCQGQTLMNHSNADSKYAGTNIRRSIIVTGDMNVSHDATKRGSPIDNFKEKGYADTYDSALTKSCPDSSCPRSTMNKLSGSTYVQEPATSYDYIFTSGDEECELEVLSHTIYGPSYTHPTAGTKRMSDHNAVSVQLRYTYPPKHQ